MDMVSYDFKAAAELVAGDVRPRLLFGPDDVAVIRRGLESVRGRRLWRGFARRAQRVCRIVCEAENLTAGLAGVAGSEVKEAQTVLRFLRDLAAYGVLAKDEAAYEAVRRILNSCGEVSALERERGRLGIGYAGGGTLALAYDMVAPQMSPDERRTFCKWAEEEVVQVVWRQLDPKFYFGPGGNIAIVGLCNATMMALALHGDKYAKGDGVVLQRLMAMVEVAVGGALAPSGFPLEDTGYGTEVAAVLALPVECARRLGVDDVAARMPRYYKFGRAALKFIQPWGEWLVNTGDAGPTMGNREFVFGRIAAATNDPAVLWLWQTMRYNFGTVDPETLDQDIFREVALGHKRQTPPSVFSLLQGPQLAKAKRPTGRTAATAFVCGRRGLVSFRSGWRDDDTLLIFDGSQRSDGAQGHHHDSAGSFSLFALGEHFGIDAGRYNVTQPCHNVVLVNSEGYVDRDSWSQALCEGRLTEYAPQRFVDSAAADATPQYGGAVRKAERRVGLVKGPGAQPYVWVQDAINANDKWGMFDWQLHTAPENKIRTQRRGAVVTGLRHGNQLGVEMFLPLFPGQRNSRDAHRIVEVFDDVAHPNAITYLGFDDPQKIKEKVAEYPRPAAMVEHGPVYERPRLVILMRGGMGGRWC